jgi:hypothetical protein
MTDDELERRLAESNEAIERIEALTERMRRATPARRTGLPREDHLNRAVETLTLEFRGLIRSLRAHFDQRFDALTDGIADLRQDFLTYTHDPGGA